MPCAEGWYELNPYSVTDRHTCGESRDTVNESRNAVEQKQKHGGTKAETPWNVSRNAVERGQ
jgi:hypothetical protein